MRLLAHFIVAIPTLASVLTLSARATAVLEPPFPGFSNWRYNVSGTACDTFNSAQTWVNVTNVGMVAGQVICPIPTGPDLVSLDAGYGPELYQVNVSIAVRGPYAELYSAVVVHDWDSDDSCTCSAVHVTHSMGHRLLSHTVNCGSCSLDRFWGVNVTVQHVSGPLSVETKAVHVYASPW